MKAGVYQGGIRTLEDLRIRCRMTSEGCWEWVGGTSGGRPSVVMKIGNRHETIKGRRAAVILQSGEIPKGYIVWNADFCNNEMCINPAHCKIGTTTAFRKAVNARRDPKVKRPALIMNGIKQRDRFAKLTKEVVVFIRLSNESSQILSKRYGVSVNTINDVISMRSWRDVAGVGMPNSSVFAWRPAA